jgi:hypothetical protein
VWLLPVYALLLALSTLTHQPDYTTDFAGYADYVTSTVFVLSHLVASILGAAIGLLGLIALFILLASGRGSRLALAGLVTSVIATVLTTSVFGVAAFAQPAIGRAYLQDFLVDAVGVRFLSRGPVEPHGLSPLGRRKNHTPCLKSMPSSSHPSLVVRSTCAARCFIWTSPCATFWCLASSPDVALGGGDPRHQGEPADPGAGGGPARTRRART